MMALVILETAGYHWLQIFFNPTRRTLVFFNAVGDDLFNAERGDRLFLFNAAADDLPRSLFVAGAVRGFVVVACSESDGVACCCCTESPLSGSLSVASESMDWSAAMAASLRDVGEGQ